MKTGKTWYCAELDTVTFDIQKEWSLGKAVHASGNLIEHKFILENISVDPLVVHEEDSQNPSEEGHPRVYAFEDYSGYGFYRPHEDPVSDAVEAPSYDLHYDILTKLWEDYPQCIDALVHIGHMYINTSNRVRHAINCYSAAVHIAEQGFPEHFDGILMWSWINNRPYLRALHGLCLALWKTEAFEDAGRIAEQMLRLCPTDNLGGRFLIDDINKHKRWEDVKNGY